VPLHWTGHSLRIGLASTARKRGRDGIAIADPGGRARHSRSMLGYMQREDGWDDNASVGLTEGGRTRCRHVRQSEHPDADTIGT
jgi:hypothetical protein